MTPSSKKLQTANLHFRQALSANRVNQAIGHLESMAAICSAPWQLREELENIRQSYTLLSDYAINGFDDPQRGTVLNDIYTRLRSLAMSIIRFCEIPDSPSRYFSIVRYENMQNDSSISELLKRYNTEYSEVARQAIFGKNEKISSLSRQAEDTGRRLFNLIWTCYPLSREDSQAILESMLSPTLPDFFKELLVSGLTLGALEFFDEEKLVLLARIYLSSTGMVNIRALVGLLLAINQHRDMLTGRRFSEIIESVKESPNWTEDLRLAYMELVRTRDTERISRKLRDEIIPQMMKLRPDILKNITSEEDAKEMMSLEENPEWAEMLDKSGLSDKLRELTELQSDGGDVMMSTFANLKHFPFFNEVANWFLPFYAEQTDIADVIGDTPSDIVDFIQASPAICDNDKYSLVLSLQQIPAANRRMMLNQFKLQDINISEIRSSELNPEGLDRKNQINKYVQDLYRFFNLYRRKSEFSNPFSKPINLAAVKLLKDSLSNSDTLSLIGEFYFRHGYYNEALDVFSIIRSTPAPSAELLQKIGYCYQQTANINNAIEAYKQSLLLRPDSLWTLRRLAQCYRLASDNKSALECYREIEQQRPNDINVTLNIAHTLLSLGDTGEALKNYFKVEYLSPDSTKVLRPIAWCLFISGDYARSKSYYDKIIPDATDSADFLNAGHLYMALRQYREAIEFYRRAFRISSKSSDDFLKLFDADRHYLTEAGVPSDIINIVADTVTS